MAANKSYNVLLCSSFGTNDTFFIKFFNKIDKKQSFSSKGRRIKCISTLLRALTGNFSFFVQKSIENRSLSPKELLTKSWKCQKNTKFRNLPASAKPRKLFLSRAQHAKSREVEPAEQGTPPFLCFFGSFFKHDFWSKIAFKKILVQKQGQRAPVLKFPGTNFTNIVDFWPWTPVS